jgi:hypothetical protein
MRDRRDRPSISAATSTFPERCHHERISAVARLDSNPGRLLRQQRLRPIDAQPIRDYIAPMRKSRLANIFLTCSIFFLQASGLHVHAHQHAGPHGLPEPAAVHLALATDHTGDQSKHHDRDAEISLPDNLIVKKAGVDKDLTGPLPAGNALPSQSERSRLSLAYAPASHPENPPPFTRPLLRAPPANHFA